jgi:hypothetical protein
MIFWDAGSNGMEIFIKCSGHKLLVSVSIVLGCFKIKAKTAKHGLLWTFKKEFKLFPLRTARLNGLKKSSVYSFGFVPFRQF